MESIRTEGLVKVFGRRVRALSGCDLQVPRGSIFGLLGRNGAGKTTLIRILLDLARPTEGKATLLGEPVGDHRVRRRVGFLPEGQAYPEYMTAQQYVTWMGVLSGLSRRDAGLRAEARLDQVGLMEAKRRRIGTFSKGMCQRTGLAAALVHEPELVFLDEPTDGVDPMGRREIRELIIGLREGGCTVFLNSHLLAEVDQTCDHIAILNRGRILASGTREEVKRTAREAGGGAGLSYRVRSQGGSLEPARDGLPGRLLQENETATDWTVHLEKAQATDALIDHLRGRGISIAALEPVETSLEDGFIALVTQDDAQHGEGTPR